MVRHPPLLLIHFAVTRCGELGDFRTPRCLPSYSVALDFSERQMPRASRRLGDRASRFEAPPCEGFAQAVRSALAPASLLRSRGGETTC
jgi:hypothetical protein